MGRHPFIASIRRRPLVWGATAWTIGTGIGLGASWTYAAVASVCLLLLAAWVRLQSGKVWPIAALAALIALSGAYAYAIDRGNRSQLEDGAGDMWDGRLVAVEGRIASEVNVDGDRVAFVLEAERLSVSGGEDGVSPNRLQDASERLRVTIRLQEQAEQEVADGWGRGDRIRLAGTLLLPAQARNEGGFDYRRYLRQQRIHWQLAVKGTSEVVHEPLRGWRLYVSMRGVDRMRQTVSAKLDALFGAKQGGYMKGLIVGIRDDLDPQTYREFAELGLTHILAISGMHVAVFLAAVLGLAKVAGLTREAQLTIGMAAVPLYVLFSGVSPSVVRAGIMAMIGLALAKRHKLKDGLHVLAAALWLMLLWNPYNLLDVGCQLSFLVTAGLILYVPRALELAGWEIRDAGATAPAAAETAAIGTVTAATAAAVAESGRRRALRAISLSLRQSLAVTVVAQLISLPVTIYYFNQFSLWSLAANYVLVPYISLIVLPLGAASLLAGMLWHPVGEAIAAGVKLLNDASFVIVSFTAELDAGTLIWASPPGWWVAAYYAAFALAVAGLLRCRRAAEGGKRLARWSLLALAGLLACAYWPLDRLGREATVHFLDVGQGDAILIRTPGERNILIDGGGTLTYRKPGEEWKERHDPFEVGRKLLVPLLKKRGVRHLDLIVATHFDRDHVGGLQAVLEDIPTDRMLLNGTWKEDANVRKLLETALRRGVRLITAEPGAYWQPDRETRLTVLGSGTTGRSAAADLSTEAGQLAEANQQNGSSVVLLAYIMGTKLLFTGDMGEREERAWLQSPEAAAVLAAYAPIDIAKIAHHGSKTSTSPQWLAAWQPREAVISAGVANVYGHPNPVVTQRIASSGAAVWRTDESGEVTVRIGRSGYSMRGYLSAGR